MKSLMLKRDITAIEEIQRRFIKTVRGQEDYS